MADLLAYVGMKVPSVIVLRDVYVCTGSRANLRKSGAMGEL